MEVEAIAAECEAAADAAFIAYTDKALDQPSLVM